MQAHLTALVLNLKRIVTLLTGVRFRPGARKTQVERSLTCRLRRARRPEERPLESRFSMQLAPPAAQSSPMNAKKLIMRPGMGRKRQLSDTLQTSASCNGMKAPV